MEMKYHNSLRIGQIRKWNRYITMLEKQANNPKYAALKINNRNGHVTQKGQVG